MCSNSITTISATIIGATISGLIGYISSKAFFNKTRVSNAFDEFINAFIDEIVIIEIAVSPKKKKDAYIVKTGQNFSSALYNARSKHRKAIEIFRLYISKKKYRKINKAYEHYYNPLAIEGTIDVIKLLSFGIYNMHEEEVEKSIGRKISGKNLAFENIKNIIKAAS